MGALQEFLMANTVERHVTKEVKLNAFPVPFVIQSITEAENKALTRACEYTEFNKKTHQKETKMDNDRYNTKLIVACCIDPNFNDAALQEKFGVRGAEALVNNLLKTGEYNELLNEILTVNGFFDDVNQLKDEAKN